MPLMQYHCDQQHHTLPSRQGSNYAPRSCLISFSRRMFRQSEANAARPADRLFILSSSLSLKFIIRAMRTDALWKLHAYSENSSDARCGVGCRT